MASVEDILATVDTWFAEEVQRAPISYHTEIYNQMHAAKLSLRDRLSVAMTGRPIEPPALPPSGDDAGTSGSGQAEESETKPDGAETGGDAGSSAKSASKPSKVG